MTETPERPGSINTDGDLTLVVAQRTTAREPRGFRIAMHTDVVDELRQACTATVQKMQTRHPLQFEPDLHFDPETHYLTVPNESTVVHREDRGRRGADGTAHPVRVETSAAARRLLSRASSLPHLDARELGHRSFLFYAAVIGSAPDRRTAFVAHWNPYKASLAGHLLTSFGDRLRRVEDLLLVFKTTFDLIVTPDGIIVLDESAFDALFRDVDSMRERIPAWSQHIVDALPLHPDTAERIQTGCRRSIRLARRARAIFEGGMLAGEPIELSALAGELAHWGINSEAAIQDNQLVLTNDQIPTLFKLLDEHLYQGWHSGTHWEAGTRSRRGT